MLLNLIIVKSMKEHEGKYGCLETNTQNLYSTCTFYSQMMLEDVKKVRARIPNIFMPLMLPHMQRVSLLI